MFKIGDRVKILEDLDVLGVKKDQLATVMNLNHNDSTNNVFINTDKLNNYNHTEFNGNGLIVWDIDLELIDQAKALVSGKWSIEDTTYLHLNYRKQRLTELAENLSRNYSSVASKARTEGLKKHTRRLYNESDISTIYHGYVDGMPLCELATKLHRTKNSIGDKLRKLKALPDFPILPKV